MKTVSISPERMALIKRAVDFQANDETLWLDSYSVEEAYIQQSLRWLHRVIDDGDREALKDIINQSKGDI